LYAYVQNNPIKFLDLDGREISYSTEKDRKFYEKAAKKNSRVRRLLAAFGPGTNRDLEIRRGNPGSHQGGFDRVAFTKVGIGRQASQTAMISAFDGAGGGVAGTAAAETVFETAANDVTGAVITLGSRATGNDKLHELGHLEQALLFPQEFLEQAEEAGRAVTVEAYNETLSEIYAEAFANETRRNDDGKP
jgi:hypothetical protein